MQRDLRHSARCVRVLAILLAPLALQPFLAHGATSSGLSIGGTPASWVLLGKPYTFQPTAYSASGRHLARQPWHA